MSAFRARLDLARQADEMATRSLGKTAGGVSALGAVPLAFVQDRRPKPYQRPARTTSIRTVSRAAVEALVGRLVASGAVDLACPIETPR